MAPAPNGSGEQRPLRVVVAQQLLGVAILGLFTQAPRRVYFHDPITGTDPVEAQVGVAVQRREETGLIRSPNTAGTSQPQSMPPHQQSQQHVASALGADSTEGRRDRRDRRRHRRSSRRSRRSDSSASSSSSASTTSRSSGSEAERSAEKQATPAGSIVIASATGANASTVRLLIKIIEAKHLPRIAARTEATTADGGAAASSAEPRAFVTLEDVFGKVEAQGRTAPLQDVRFTEAHNGCGDRTNCVLGTSPRFDYAAVMEIGHIASPSGLASLRFAIYHHQGEAPGPKSRNSTLRQPSGDSLLDKETQFWSRAQKIGAVDVPLHTLRFLPHGLDGWYHIVSSNHAVTTHVGQVRLAIQVVRDDVKQ